MKKYLAIYMGTATAMANFQKLDEKTRKDREQTGIAAWKKWVETNKKAVTELGSPLGKTKRIDAKGVSDMKNEIGAWTVVEAESYEAAANLFLNHPHFTIFPGDHVEIMECLKIPGM
jgi:hypothetical protein